jgi:hypothetical protein
MKTEFELNVKKKNGKKPRIVSKQQYLVWKYCKNPEDVSWPNEVKIASSLFEKYPNFDFWRSFILDFKLNSLAYFLSGPGINLLSIGYRKHSLPQATEVRHSLLEHKIGDDKVIIHRKKTLKDFLT